MYPETINLPFNRAVTTGIFVPSPPGSPDTGESGAWVLIRGGALVVDTAAATPKLPEGDLPWGADVGASALYLGLWEGKPLRLLRLGKEVELPPSFSAEPFNAIEERLDDRLLTIGGIGNQILHWERHSTRCSRCGADVVRIAGTWGKRCIRCSAEHFPHVHPCVIVLIRRGEQFLLVRKPEWRPGRFGLVAGFLDMGESLEECVHREVKEETGVDVAGVTYVGSQSWPFPSQLMAGFVAEYAGGDLVVDKAELEDAQWFSSDNLPGGLPPRRSIARWLIDRCITRGEY